MINIKFLNGTLKSVFGNKITDIEGWEEALFSDEMYVPHHVLEWLYTKEELKAMNRYDDVSPDELIWMPRSVHNSNSIIHKGIANKIKIQTGKKMGEHSLEWRMNIGKSKMVDNNFTDKFIKHFGIYSYEDRKLYNKEKMYYYRHNKRCRWE